jgi:hypothetical protein
MELVETGNLELHKWDSQLSKDDEVELWVRIPVLPGEEDTYEELDEMTRKQTGEKPDREAGPNPYCLCGCGERTQTKKAAFVPGHDAKFSGRLKRIARGKYTDEDVETTLGNDEAMDHAKIQKSNYMQENIAAAREALPKWESERKKDPEQNVLKNGIPGKKRGKAA